MKRTAQWAAGAILVGVFFLCIAAAPMFDTILTGLMTVDERGTVDFKGGKLMLHSVEVTAHAAEINSAAAGTTAALTPTSIINSGYLQVGGSTYLAGPSTNAGNLNVTGALNVGVGIDAIGNVDMDYGSADVTDHTFLTDGTGTGEIVLPGSAIDGSEISDGTISNADIAASAAIVVSKLGASSRGAVSNTSTVASETVAELNKTVLTVGFSGLLIADTTLTTNKLLYTFPEGRISVEGVTVSMVTTNTTNFNVTVNDVYSWSLGGAGNGDATADAAEVTFLAAQSCDTVSGTTRNFTNKTAIAAEFQVDGTTTQAPLWMHFFIADACDITGSNNYFGATGTVTITWVNLGDY